MIRINVRAIVAYLIFFLIVWYGHPAWIALAVWLVEHSAVRWALAGFVAGCFVPISIGWNMALRYRRDGAIEKATKEYDQDRKKVLR